MSKNKPKRIALYISEDDKKLLEKVDEFVENSNVYQNRTHFTKTAWRYFLKYAMEMEI